MNNLVYFVDANGEHQWKEYDKEYNLINCSIPDYKELNECDSNGNLIHSRNSNGYEYWNEYDKNSKLIHFRDSNGYNEFYTYYDNEYVIRKTYPIGFEDYYHYDYNDNLLYITNDDGDKYIGITEDKFNKMINN